MYIIKTSSQYEKDYKKILKSGQKNMQKINTIMRRLTNAEKLEKKYKDHGLIGNYKEHRECHIEPDWLLIYKIKDDEITFERTGNHSNLYK